MKTSARIWLAIGATALAGLVLVIPMSMSMITFLRERMHFSCSFARMGSDDPGSYLCSDGIGYILPGLVVWFGIGVLFLATAIATGVLVPRPLLAMRAVTITGLAGLVLTVVVSLLADSGRHPADGIPAGTWVTVMAVPSVLFGLAVIAMVVAVAARSATPALAGLLIALVLVLAATLVEPTLVFGAAQVLIATGIGIALARRRVHAQVRGPERSATAR